jgi:hypothetical protein
LDGSTQGPLIFQNLQNNVNNAPSSLYKSDSVFIYICYSTDICPKVFAKCSNSKSISSLHNLLGANLFGKDQLTRSKQSTIQTKEGISYLEFFSTVVVADLGKQKLLIPKIYSDTCGKDFEHYKCCEKEFSHVFLIIDLLDFRYASSKEKEVFRRE